MTLIRDGNGLSNKEDSSSRFVILTTGKQVWGSRLGKLGDYSAGCPRSNVGLKDWRCGILTGLTVSETE